MMYIELIANENDKDRIVGIDFPQVKIQAGIE